MAQATDVKNALRAMATAIAARRRADDLKAFGKRAPGDAGAYLPMDMRAAEAALKAFVEFSNRDDGPKH